MTAKNIAGGAAVAGGMDFQHRGAAWVAVHILGEKDASPPWNIPVGVTLEWLRCETEQSVDDLLVGTSEDGLIFVQFKRHLDLSVADDSHLASAIDQFVRQFLACRNKPAGRQPLERPLDPQKDRLVIITSPSSSRPIRIDLRNLLQRIKQLQSHQKLDDAAGNDSESKALSLVRKHIATSWKISVGTDPTENEIQQILSLIRVEVMDLDDGSVSEREAKNILRTSILKNPDNTDMAWSRLISSCGSLAAKRSGADRLNIQFDLLKAGLPLKAVRSYQDDIEKLQGYSEGTFAALAHFAEIRVGPKTIKIQRPCTEALRQTVEEKSVLIVGDPGAGKSGALHDLVNALKQDGRECIVLAVDRLAARSLGELRNEIGLDHELIKVLDNWPGLQPAFIIIDAMDAARADPSGMMIRDLIRQMIEKGGRWRVVASIRKFDLRYGVEIKGLFVGRPMTKYHDLEFKDVCHVNIPDLSEDEFGQVASQSSEMQALIRDAPGGLRKLMRLPFNLRLMAELLGTGVNPDELTPIRTQLELLDRYWLYRVIRSDRQGDGREAVLRQVCERMVKARALRVDRSAVANPENSTLIGNLLSEQVLIEWQPSPDTPPDRYILAFAHNVLFDYAVARLLLRSDPESVVRRFGDNPELVIVIRPSLLLHLHHLWKIDSDHRQFWDLVIRIIQSATIPEIGKLIGPSVAAELSRGLYDLKPMLDVLEKADAPAQNEDEQSLGHLIGALLAGGGGSYEIKLLGAGAGPWCELLEYVSRHLRPSIAYIVRSLMLSICEHPEDFTPEQRTTAGRTARRLLEFAWSQTPRNSWLVIHALQCVCRTFESDPSASALLLRGCLNPQHFLKFGFEEMPWLARETKRLIPMAPELVEEIYRIAFSNPETSEEPTPLGQSRILALVGTRRQDYQMGLYELAQVFPQYLSEAPKQATHAMIAIMEAYVSQRKSTESSEWHEETFEFKGQKSKIRSDYSFIWDESGAYSHEDPLKVLGAFQQYLEELSVHNDEDEVIDQLVQILVSNNCLAVIWRRLLLLGARFSNTIGRAIIPLAWAMPILTCIDTTIAVGEFIKAIFPTLNDEERKQIEQAILGIPEAVSADHREGAEQMRNRLLGCLSDQNIVTEEARLLLMQLRNNNVVPPNESPIHFGGVTSAPYSEKEFLRDEGVPVDAEPNRNIQELEQPIKQFADKHLNSVPTLQEANALLPALQALHKALRKAVADGVHPKQSNYAYGYLAAACARIARTEGLSCAGGLGAFVRDSLLETSSHPEPTHHPEDDARFDEHPLWGSPAARIEAAEGLVVLAHQRECVEQNVLTAIEHLSSDPAPAVRFQIASKLNALYETAQELMWRLMERISRGDQSRGVLQGLVIGPFNRLMNSQADRIACLAKEIFNRVRDGPGAEMVRELCAKLFADLYIWRNHAMSNEMVLGIVTNLASNLNETHHVLSRLREPMKHPPAQESDPEADGIRHRAQDLLERIFRSAHKALADLENSQKGKPPTIWPKNEQEKAKSLLRLIDGIGSEVYFDSGAYDAERQGKPGVFRKPNPESQRFYRETAIILDELAEAGLPSVTHHLLETLDFFVPIDPHGVFLRIGKVLRAGKRGGYQYESLAVDLIVKLVERYLAEYRSLLRENEECRSTLIDILDLFVQAGWPSARRLTYRLEEIYR